MELGRMLKHIKIDSTQQSILLKIDLKDDSKLA